MSWIESMRDSLRVGGAAILDPGADPIAALVALAAVVLALLVMILVAYLFLISFENKGTPVQSDAAAPEPRRQGQRRVLGVALMVLLVAAMTYGWGYSASDRMCARCHFTEDAVKSHADGTHSGVSCRDCHIGPSVDAAAFARARGLQNVATQLMGAPEGPVRASVPNGACLACHQDILKGVTTARSIRIRHADVLELDQACIDCHNTEGHGKEVAKEQYPRMSQCIVCHDGERESAECGTCHSEDVGVAVRRPERPYAQTHTERRDCRGCHSMDGCIECHGLELPHSQEFIDGFHARPALLELDMCMECHSVNWCNQCHQFDVLTADAADWVRQHGTVREFLTWHASSSPVGLGSCSCHDADRNRFCSYCHGPQPER